MSNMFWIFISLIPVLWGSAQNLQDRPEIVSKLEIASSTIGGVAKIRCHYRNKWESSQVQWVKLNPTRPLIISLGTKIEVKDNPNKYKIAESSENEIHSSLLTIKNLVKSDEGRYRCVVRTRKLPSPKFWAKEDDILRILEPAQITGLSADKDLVDNRVLLDPGEGIKIQCKTAGFPLPVVKWMRTDVLPEGEILFDTASFEMTNLTSDDTGSYMCVAESEIGPVANVSVFIGVRMDLSCSQPLPGEDGCVPTDDGALKIDFSIQGFPPAHTIMMFKGSTMTLNNTVFAEYKSSGKSRARIVEGEAKVFNWNTALYRLIVDNATKSDIGSYYYHAYKPDSNCMMQFNVTRLCQDEIRGTENHRNHGNVLSSTLALIVLTFFSNLIEKF